MIDSSKISEYHKNQISYLQQGVWSLQQARAKIFFARGNSDVGKCYLENIDSLIEEVEEDINNIYDAYNKD